MRLLPVFQHFFQAPVNRGRNRHQYAQPALLNDHAESPLLVHDPADLLLPRRPYDHTLAGRSQHQGTQPRLADLLVLRGALRSLGEAQQHMGTLEVP